MRIPSKDVIQADSPDRVMMTIDAVSLGARTDDDIAAAIGGLVDRQGRYYRRAAETLGFITRDGDNHSIPTPQGREYANAERHLKQPLFVRAVLRNPLFQRLLTFVDSKGVAGATRENLEAFLDDVAVLGAESMVKRRVSSYIQWLLKLGLAEERRGRYVLRGLPDIAPIIAFQSDEEPIFPRRYELNEYREQAARVARRRAAVAFYVNQALQERASASHEALVRLMANRLREHGAVPKANRYVDLSASLGGADFLFEMKSTTEDNPHGQVRRGLSQLYEYRYLQNIPAPRLVLVLENPLPADEGWIKDYLIQDRGILLVWDGNGRFSCPPEIADQLPFLN
jgi:hypothetical protein